MDSSRITSEFEKNKFQGIYLRMSHYYTDFSRAGTSSSLDGVCAVINNAYALLETDFCEVLRRQLRQGYPSGYLDLTQAYSVLHTSIQQGRLQASDSEQARLMFLVSPPFIQSNPVP
jgi:hypothetical protein